MQTQKTISEKIVSFILSTVLVLASAILALNPNEAFASYQRTADNTVPAYADRNLRNRNGNERVDRGDVVTVFEETDNAYYVRYPVRNGTKDRWVPKNIFNGGQPNGSYDSKVNSFKNESRFRNGANWSAGQRPTLVASNLGTGCNAYARDFVKYVFGKQLNRGQTFSSVNDIRNGDVLKVVNSQHWIVVLYRNGNNLSTAEGNWGGKVVISDSAYSIQNGRLYRNGKPFRTFSLGYHFQ